LIIAHAPRSSSAKLVNISQALGLTFFYSGKICLSTSMRAPGAEIARISVTITHAITIRTPALLRDRVPFCEDERA
jgi:hypothetical protein